MGQNVNRWIGTGNLTRDPELRALPSGMSVCTMRLACNGRRKNKDTGEWEDDPNYFDVTVWGAQGENCARYLGRGRAVAIDGRLDWREWQAQDGTKRQAVQIVADSVQFLGGQSDGGQQSSTPASTSPASAGDMPQSFDAVPGTSTSDDIPFLWRPVDYDDAKAHRVWT